MRGQCDNYGMMVIIVTRCSTACSIDASTVVYAVMNGLWLFVGDGDDDDGGGGGIGDERTSNEDGDDGNDDDDAIGDGLFM